MYRPNRIGPYPVLPMEDDLYFQVGPPTGPLPITWDKYSRNSADVKKSPICITPDFLMQPRTSVSFYNGSVANLGEYANFSVGLPVKQIILADKNDFPQDGYLLQVWGTVHAWGVGGIQAASIIDGFFITQSPQTTWKANEIMAYNGIARLLPTSSEFMAQTTVDTEASNNHYHAHAHINTTVIIQPDQRAYLGTPWDLCISVCVANVSPYTTQTLIHGELGYSFYDRDLKVFDPNL